MKEVIATDTGFFDGARRRKDEKFLVPKTAKASWFVPTVDPQAVRSGRAATTTAAAQAKAEAKAEDLV